MFDVAENAKVRGETAGGEAAAAFFGQPPGGTTLEPTYQYGDDGAAILYDATAISSCS